MNTEANTVAPSSPRQRRPNWRSVVGIVGLLALSALAYWSSQQIVAQGQQQARRQLEAVRAVKTQQLDAYFTRTRQDLTTLVSTVATFHRMSRDKLLARQTLLAAQLDQLFQHHQQKAAALAALPVTHDLFAQLDVPHGALSAETEFTRSNPPPRESQILQDIARQWNLDEVLLFCAAHGHLLFTTDATSTRGSQSLTQAPVQTPLRQLWQRVVTKRGFAMSDFVPDPARGQTLAYLGYPLWQAGEVVGVIVVTLPLAPLNRLLQQPGGIGRSGESYLIGTDHSLRTDLRRDTRPTAQPPQSAKIHYDAVKLGLQNQKGHAIGQGLNGELALMVWTPWSFADLKMVLMTEMNLDEALVPVDSKGREFFAKYRDLFGYEDILLVHHDGQVVYHATDKPAARFSLFEGEYRESALTRLIYRVRDSKRYAVADYVLWQGEPSLFVAMPLIKNQRVDLILALQLPANRIEAIMQQRDGLGDSGEAYLVGPDKRMRSGAFFDPEARSLRASLKGTVEDNGVDTEAVREALAGREGIRSLVSYHGSAVLAAYAPVRFNALQWALVVEIDDEEWLAPIREAILRARYLAIGLAGLSLLILVIELIVWLASWRRNIPSEPRASRRQLVKYHDFVAPDEHHD